MKKEINPVVAAPVIAVVLLILFFAWRSITRPSVQVHKIQFGTQFGATGIGARKQHMADLYNRNAVQTTGGGSMGAPPTGQ